MNERSYNSAGGRNEQLDWWLGVADVLAVSSGHGVEKLERIHLAIADESFQVLDAVVVTRPFARLVKRSHDGITSLCYGAVRLGFHSVGEAISRRPGPGLPDHRLSEQTEERSVRS